MSKRKMCKWYSMPRKIDDCSLKCPDFKEFNEILRDFEGGA